MQKWGVGTICLLMLVMLAYVTPLAAQSDGAEKAPSYIYVSNWAVPRGQWGDMAKLGEQDRALEDKLMADGTITAYGQFINLIHSEGLPTHGDWFVATSEGNVVKALAAFYSRAGTTSDVLAASKHQDHFLVSRIHNSRSGTFEDACLAGSMWEVKPGRMQAFEGIIKARLVPMFEKELSDGALVSYSVDTQDFHTESPGLISIVFVATDAAGLDKVNAAFEAAFGKDTEIGPALSALTVEGSHRDFLYRVLHMRSK